MSAPGRACSTPSGDRGASDALGLVLLAPVMLGVALMILFLGRQVDAQAQVRAAAESAAQAGALERDVRRADQAARAAASAMLVDIDTCLRPGVDVDLSRFAPGGDIAVTVRCEVSTRGLGPVAIPGRAFAARAVARVDPHREVDR